MVITRLRRSLKTRGLGGTLSLLGRKLYQRSVYWRRCQQEKRKWPQTRLALTEAIQAMPRHPKLAVVMPVYDPPLELLREAIASVRAQVYPHWELCIADDASPRPEVRALLTQASAEDARIKLVLRERNGHISASSNSALELVAADFFALLDHDDLLSPDALYWVAEEILAYPDAVMAYSDEDKVSPLGQRRDPYFKPDWNPALLLNQNCISHLGVYCTERVRVLGGFREGYEGSQDYDLALRVSETAGPEQIRHIPRVLYHWRITGASTAGGVAAKPYAIEAGQRALSDALARRGIAGKVQERPALPGFYRVVPHLPEHSGNGPRLSVLLHGLHHCLDLAGYVKKLSVVMDGFGSWELLLSEEEREKLLNTAAPMVFFPPSQVESFASLINQAARHAQGELLLLLDARLLPKDSASVAMMAGFGRMPGMGAIGGKVVDGRGRTLFGGVVFDRHTKPCFLNQGLPADAPGYFGQAALVQNFGAVHGGCLLVEKDAFLALGGLREEVFQGADFAGFDFCLRLERDGRRNVWCADGVFWDESGRWRVDEGGRDTVGLQESRAFQETWEGTL